MQPQRESAGRGEAVREGDTRGSNTAGVTREPPIPGLHSGKPGGLRTVVPPGGAQDPDEEQRLGHQRGGQVCIRAEGAETDKVPHEQARVGAKRKNRERQVLRGEVHREADEKWQDGAPEPNAAELEGEEGRLREEGGRQKRVEHEGSGERDREGVHRRGAPDNHEVTRKQPRRGFQADDDDERCKRREKPEETALRRQTRKGRSREGGTQGGKTADAPDD